MEGRHHLDAAIGSRSFVTQYMQEKVDYWMSCVQKLSTIARVQPHVAYYAFTTHGLIGNWTYFLCTIPDVYDLLEPLKATITGKQLLDELEIKLF